MLKNKEFYNVLNSDNFNKKQKASLLEYMSYRQHISLRKIVQFVRKGGINLSNTQISKLRKHKNFLIKVCTIKQMDCMRHKIAQDLEIILYILKIVKPHYEENDITTSGRMGKNKKDNKYKTECNGGGSSNSSSSTECESEGDEREDSKRRSSGSSEETESECCEEVEKDEKNGSQEERIETDESEEWSEDEEDGKHNSEEQIKQNEEEKEGGENSQH